ncbi:MAG TPA: PIG-L family deacetylase [Cellulomonadaceae bacterium]|nr:PIG-L family deacetylase [Cellulomonadaceae bacterium]
MGTRRTRARLVTFWRADHTVVFGAIGASLVVRGFLISLVTALVPIAMPPVAIAPDRTTTCLGGAMQVVAHEDDDLIFQNPDILHDIDAGRCVRTVFVTAGDAAQGEIYWKSRENGSRAAYAHMAGVANTWTTTDAGVPGRAVRLQTLIGAPNVSLVFMRLPDGDRTGSGLVVHDRESLMRLWQGAIGSIGAVDGSARYTESGLRSTLAALMTEFAPTTVRTQDWTIPFRHGDHADHTATALLARQASQDYASAHTLLAYGGYPTWTRLVNVTGVDLRAKESTFLAYASHDRTLCLDPWCPIDVVYSLRLSRQYVVASESAGNSARGTEVRVTASSEDVASGQSADRAVDGYALGEPSAHAREWATEGGRAGSWLRLDFPAPTTIDGVVLYDRPNLRDQITGGVLEFSDGSTVSLGALPNNGSGLTVRFPARAVTSVRLLVTAVSATTTNVGLAEIETYATVPGPSAGPRATDAPAPPS